MSDASCDERQVGRIDRINQTASNRCANQTISKTDDTEAIEPEESDTTATSAYMQARRFVDRMIKSEWEHLDPT